jgi:membrane protein
MFGFLKRVFSEFGKDKAGLLSSAFAYTAVFSIGPLLLVLVSIVGFIYGDRAAQGQLASQLSGTVGPDTAKTLQDLVAHTSSTGKGVVGIIVGVIGLLLGAGSLTAQLQNSFDIILRAKGDPKAGIKFTIYTKLKNIGVVMLAAVAALASLVLSALISGLGKSAGLEVINTVASLAVFIGVLYMIYRFLPDVVIPRLLSLKTAGFIALLFLVGKFILGFVIGRNGTAGAYGAAASVIVLLLWFFYTAQILLLGAEGIKVYGENHKLEFKPKRYAVKQKELDVLNKFDLRGRLLEAFSRGYKSKSRR